MKRYLLWIALAASLLVNIGVVTAVVVPGLRTGAAIEKALFGMRHEEVPKHLGLDARQRERWQALEAGFVESLDESARRIAGHRERLVRDVLSERPDPAVIERERAAIFALQEAQQRAVISQLLEERELLRPEQRAALADLLLSQPAGPRR
jgi:hypothetical protein